ncbi:Uncharacterized protein HZ326_24384 [Fusarium oxysporum f. sp. albedinis]|nr:Uncharacterized protein HZ326_24384 [Fusarium oxysporum f. sp. albedinis]
MSGRSARRPELQRIILHYMSSRVHYNPSLATSGAPLCIMVAITSLVGDKAEEEPEYPRSGLLRKRRIVLITRPQDQK